MTDSLSIRDRLGRAFDNLKFRLGGDGRPRFDKLGRFVNLRGGRKKKMETPSPTPSVDPHASNDVPASTPAPTPEPAQKTEPTPNFSDVKKALDSMPAGGAADPAAQLAAEIETLGDNPTAETIIGLIQTGLVLIGDEEGILTAQEKALLRRPLVRVLDKYNIGASALPAEVDLALCVLGLLAARLQKPKTATFALKIKAWVVRQFFASKGEKMAATLRSEVGESVKAGGAS